MNIERVDDGDSGAFVVRNPQGDPPLFAEITWEWRDGNMVILHTGVREQLRGQGAARKLVEATVAAAREEGFKIEPVCPYAQKVLADPQYADVLAS